MTSQIIELGASDCWPQHNTAYSTGSIICQAKCKMKLQGPLLKKCRRKAFSFFLRFFSQPTIMFFLLSERCTPSSVGIFTGQVQTCQWQGGGVDEPQDGTLTWDPPTTRSHLLPATRQLPQEVKSGHLLTQRPGIPHPGPNLQDRIFIAVGERLALSLSLHQMYLIAGSLEKEGQRLRGGEEQEPRWAGAPHHK